MKKTIIAGITFLAFLLPGKALEVCDQLEISGYIKNETAYRVSNPDNWMKIRNGIALKADYSPLSYLSAFINLRYYYDSVYDANNEFSTEAARQLRKPLYQWDWLRECYVDYTSDLLDVRLGKQTIVWGTADGVKVLDMVNPMDMREFTLAPFDNSRIPLWTAKMEMSPTVNSTFQAFLIPYNFVPNYIPPDGSPFTFRATRVGETRKAGLAQMGYHINNINDEPANAFENSRFGFRWLDILGNFEYSLNYLQGHNLSSVVNATVDASTATGLPPASGLPPAGSTFTFNKEYPYVHIAGASCSYGINSGLLEGLTVRGEFAYTHGDENGFGEDSRQIGLTDVDRYNYVIGLDRYFLVKYLFSFQFIQFIDSRDGAVNPQTGVEYPLLMGATYHPREQVETILSLKVSTQYFWDQLKPEVIILYGQHGDWRISPQASYEITDDLILTAGTHILTGSETTLFGQFHDDKEIFLTMKYGF